MSENSSTDLIKSFEAFLKSHSYHQKDDECIYRFDRENQLLFIIGLETERKSNIFFECIPLVSLTFYPDSMMPQGGCWNTTHIIVRHERSFAHTSLEEQSSFFCQNIFPSFNALSTTEAALRFNQKMGEFLHLKYSCGSMKTPLAWLLANRADEAIHFCEHNIGYYKSFLEDSSYKNTSQIASTIRELTDIKSHIQAQPEYYWEEIEKSLLENRTRLEKYLSTLPNDN